MAVTPHSKLSTPALQVMSLWPFRQMILRGGQRQQQEVQSGLQPHALFQFGDATEIRRVLGMTNRLTGCAAQSCATLLSTRERLHASLRLAAAKPAHHSPPGALGDDSVTVIYTVITAVTVCQ